MKRRWFVIMASGLTLLLGLLLAAACAGPAGEKGPQGPPGPEGLARTLVTTDLTCTKCHDSSTRLLAKRLQWEESKHAKGGTYLRSTSASCAGCHSSEGFAARVEAGIQPDQVKKGVANPSPQNCRTCHKIHTTYTEADFALTTQKPVTLMVSGETFDKGKGNLCAACHQPRQGPPAEGVGEVEVTSSHWGPHRTQASTLLGIGGYGVAKTPSPHLAVADSCVTCHMGPDKIHTKEAQLSACQTCHADLKSFDRNKVQTEVKALFKELEELLKAKGAFDNEGNLKPGKYSEAVAGAVWNYNTVEYDRSLGVHNPAYVKALLQKSIEALK